MKFRNLAAAAAAFALTVSPVMAQASSPAKASSEVSRSVSTSKKSSNIKGMTVIVALLGFSAVIGGVVIAADKKSNTPTSP